MTRSLRAVISASLILAIVNFAPSAKAVPSTCSYSTATTGGYTYVAFKVAGTTCVWDLPAGVSAADFLVVAGGGGGGTRHAGGGGAGGLLKPTSVSLTNVSTLQIYVGNGGAGSISGTGSNGESTTVTKYAGSGSFSTLSAIGGGGGGGFGNVGLVGGSGGGSYNSSYVDVANTGIAGTAGQGTSGGTGGYGRNITMWASGGGGGATSAGVNASESAGGAGGSGSTWIASFTSSIASALGLTDTSTVFAGGGGGGITLGSGTANGGAGGSGGGGAGGGGGDWNTFGPAGAKGGIATANTGGGGGGSGLQQGQGNSAGGAGGSGIVMLRYVIPLATVTAPTYTAPITKGTVESMTVTTSVSGKVRFFINGKRISGCLSVATTGSGANITATCTWKPSVSGNHRAYASITPSDLTMAVANSSTAVIPVLRRTNTR